MRPHMVVVHKGDRAFRNFSWDDLLIAEIQGRGVITIDSDDARDSEDEDDSRYGILSCCARA